jgi:hypothetical protein
MNATYHQQVVVDLLVYFMNVKSDQNGEKQGTFVTITVLMNWHMQLKWTCDLLDTKILLNYFMKQSRPHQPDPQEWEKHGPKVTKIKLNHTHRTKHWPYS